MELIFDLFYKILSMTDTLFDFIFKEINLTAIGLGKVSMWAILSGSLIVITLGVIIAKKLLN